MSNRLKLVLLKAERAYEQIRDLDTSIRAFYGTLPYSVSIKRDPQTGNTIHYLAKVDDIPPIIPNLTGEAIHSIRSTLDHLAYQLFLVRRIDSTDEGNSISFPIYDPAKTTEASAFGKIKILGDEAIEGIRACKPYKGGNDLLWAINKLDNIGKHRTLLTVGAASKGLAAAKVLNKLWNPPGNTLRINFHHGVTIPFAEGFRFPLNVSDILHIGPAEWAEVNKDLEFAFTIVLSEPGIIGPKPVCEVLLDMIHHVRDIVCCFEPLL